MARHEAAHKHLRKKRKKQPFDYVVLFFTVATPLFELPQSYTIFSTKDASGVSLATWGFFLMASIVFATYSFREKIRPWFITSILFALIEGSIVTGIIMYS
jgi:uncharacterized protein with PQ loop repeat